MNCRFCGTPLQDVFLDLGTAPPSNAFLSAEALERPEFWFPLKVITCRECHLVQVDEVQQRERLFAPDYAYYSSYSRSWLAHAARYVDKAVARLGLGAGSLVIEVASNDGYLLQYVSERGIPCVGIEPTAGTAEAARAKGIETLVRFFGAAFARELVAKRGHADLIVGNNVLAHVPDINDFVAGLATLLATGRDHGRVPAPARARAERQFDTVYHEHFSYLSFHTVRGSLLRMDCASGMSSNCPPMAVHCASGPATRMPRMLETPRLQRCWRWRAAGMFGCLTTRASSRLPRW